MAARPSKAELHRAFALYNAAHFDGRLREPAIHWCRMRQYGEWNPACASYPHGRIVLSTMHMPRCGWRGILLHEMVHAWLERSGGEVDHDDTRVEHHGPLFAGWCNAIGARLGLPAVSVDECAAWPWHADESVIEFHAE